MNPIDFISVSTKAMKAYESYCQPLCKKYQFSQTCFDVLMFLANNPHWYDLRCSRFSGKKRLPAAADRL